MAAEVEVQYFAAARELCGKQRERLRLERSPSTVREVLEQLGRHCSALLPVIHRMRLAVNGEIARAEDQVRDGDELAVLPPVAGGACRVVLCALRDTPLSIDEVLAAVRAPGVGAEVLFVGSVRDHADGKAVARLDYEAHPSMAEREMTRVLTEISAARPEVRLAALHRVGALAVGDLAVVVAAAAPHRAEAFEACREAIERIKQRVPIWKKEWAPDGSANWVNLDG
ncbi:MAG: molybdenum cofactor biosynthesis protein MoaE [Polyangiales bacterium]